MLMKKLIYCLILCLLLIACGQKTQPSLTTLVNPLIGTSSTFQFSHGNTYPAVAVPWGMNFWSPQTGENGSGWMYMYTDSLIRGSARLINLVRGLMIMALSPLCLYLASWLQIINPVA